eukprot:CAMPEP_0119355274 /NCGR_PEP_ID=MMETSP1334-20130426/4125_1 /TAXON_ID=127549 /ORGANISM="Calcidiscus leptoporus, Strain RCC1130" /LENGTH=104 /DNA_ID=CAMNT_0007369047 /DNA_START=41 /DNA_END=353 /DNA_ORIENTATION=-
MRRRAQTVADVTLAAAAAFDASARHSGGQAAAHAVVGAVPARARRPALLVSSAQAAAAAVALGGAGRFLRAVLGLRELSLGRGALGGKAAADTRSAHQHCAVAW